MTDDDYLQPQKAAAWNKSQKVPVIDAAMRTELVRIAKAVEQAIYDDEKSIPREVRVYYQSLKFIASVAGAPEGRKWYGSSGPVREDALTDDRVKVAEEIDAKMQQMMIEGCDDLAMIGRLTDGDMEKFKWLVETTAAEALYELCVRYDGFYHLVDIVQSVRGDRTSAGQQSVT
jgi:hypothetical protein